MITNSLFDLALISNLNVGMTDSIPTTGLIGWWKASSIRSYNDTNLFQWPDSSGNNNHLTQSNATYQPTLATNFVNGKNAVEFSQSWFDFSGSVVKDLTMAEIYAVIKLNVDPPTDKYESGLWDWGNSSLITHFPATIADGVGNIYESFGRLGRADNITPTKDLTSWSLYNISSAPDSWSSSLDTVSLFSTTDNTVTFDTNGRCFVGKGVPIDTFDYYLNGYISEIILYNITQSNVDKNTIQQYLKTKYNLSY